MPAVDKTTFVCVDCETTGLDAVQDRVIEVAAVKFTTTSVLAEFDALINPECPIPESSIVFHHITDDMIRDKPKIKEILPEILELIGGDIIVGHGIGFDIQLLINAAERHGIPCTLKNNKQLDTLRMARRYGESPVNSLEQLRKHFNIQPEGAHRAMSDVIVNMEVFKRLAKFYKTTEDIFETLSHPILFKVMPLGPHKGRLMKDIPLHYLLWAVRQDFDGDLLFTLRTEIKKRKQGNLFSQANNPFGQL